jgi:hypothetical protein
MHFAAKQFRHQDTKTQRLILTNRFALCLCAIVAIFPIYPDRVISFINFYHETPFFKTGFSHQFSVLI